MECHCSCHGNMAERIMHIMPCCVKCPTCRRRIVYGFWDRHLAEHLKEYKPLDNEYEDD